MNDNEIKAALAEIGAGWLMDSSDEHCQSKALRHLVSAVKASEREWWIKHIRNEIGHAETNETRIEPSFGKARGDFAVRVMYLIALVDRANGKPATSEPLT